MKAEEDIVSWAGGAMDDEWVFDGRSSASDGEFDSDGGTYAEQVRSILFVLIRVDCILYLRGWWVQFIRLVRQGSVDSVEPSLVSVPGKKRSRRRRR